MADDRRTGSDELDRRIADAKAEQRAPVTASQGAAESRGWAVGIEFVGTFVISGFIGWLIDRYFGTAPWAMIVLLLLGFAAATRRAAKTSKQFDAVSGNDGDR